MASARLGVGMPEVNMRSGRVCELALGEGWPERVLKSMLGKGGQMWACPERLG